MNKFACFVMTYRRPAILSDTIIKLFDQSLPPEKILIVDNDPDKSAEKIPLNFPGKSISYYSVGYNSGPAGAAYYGLKILSEEGWDWIGWIDDDDPPVFDDVYSCLLQLLLENSNCGCAGAVGHLFNKKNGLLIRLNDESLSGSGIIEVDNIAGGMSKIINGKAVRDNDILPEKSLFFGFEEFDFDLKLKNAGFNLLVDKNLYLKHRIHFNRLGKKKVRYSVNVDSLWRQYFSSRNMLIIMVRNRYYTALILSFFRVLFKGVLGFRNGWTAGKKTLYYNSLALFHFLTNRRGNPFLN